MNVGDCSQSMSWRSRTNRWISSRCRHSSSSADHRQCHTREIKSMFVFSNVILRIRSSQIFQWKEISFLRRTFLSLWISTSECPHLSLSLFSLSLPSLLWEWNECRFSLDKDFNPMLEDEWMTDPSSSRSVLRRVKCCSRTKLFRSKSKKDLCEDPMYQSTDEDQLIDHSSLSLSRHSKVRTTRRDEISIFTHSFLVQSEVSCWSHVYFNRDQFRWISSMFHHFNIQQGKLKLRSNTSPWTKRCISIGARNEKC